MTSESGKKMVKFSGEGNLQVNIDPGAMACEKEHGLTIKPAQGSAIVFYDLLADGAMNGKVDPNTLYQYCGDKGMLFFFFFFFPTSCQFQTSFLLDRCVCVR